MRKFLLYFFLLCSFCLQAQQDYEFLTPFSKKMKHSDYTDFISSSGYRNDSLNHIKPYHYLETGLSFSKAYTDSISKTKDSYKYRTFIYRDTLTNQFSFVLHKQTDEEMVVESEYWKQSIKEDEANRKKLRGTVVNDLTLVDMEGTAYTMESLEGKIIVIDFWFVNCGSCILEMPELNELKEKYGTDDIAWFGITFDAKEKVEKFSKRTKFDYTLIPDGEHITDRFSIKFYPTTLILNPDREIVYTGENGPLGGRIKEIKKELKKLLKHKKKRKIKTVVSGPVNN